VEENMGLLAAASVLSGPAKQSGATENSAARSKAYGKGRAKSDVKKARR
jgi:hypothetical protein